MMPGENDPAMMTPHVAFVQKPGDFVDPEKPRPGDLPPTHS